MRMILFFVLVVQAQFLTTLHAFVINLKPLIKGWRISVDDQYEAALLTAWSAGTSSFKLRTRHEIISCLVSRNHTTRLTIREFSQRFKTLSSSIAKGTNNSAASRGVSQFGTLRLHYGAETSIRSGWSTWILSLPQRASSWLNCDLIGF